MSQAKPTPSENYQTLNAMLRDGVDQLRWRAADSALIRAELNGVEGMKFKVGVGFQQRNMKARRKPKSHALKKFYRWWMRKMFKTKPTITAYAGGKENVDSERAQVAEAIFDHWRSNNGWMEAEKEVARWVFACGRGYCEPVWSQIPTFTKRVRRRKMGETPTKNRRGRLSFVVDEEQTVFGGDMKFRVHNPDATFLFPLSAKRWEEVNQILTADVVSKDYLERFAGKALKEEDLIEVEESNLNYDLVDSVAKYTGSYVDTSARREKRYLLIVSRERPSFAHPQGRLNIVAGGVDLVKDEPLPYLDEAREVDPTDCFNLTMGIIPWFGERVAGTLLPPSRARVLKDAEVDIDALMDDIATNRRQFGKNRFIGPKSELQDNEITEEHGQVLTYAGAGREKVTVLQAQPLVGALQEQRAAEDNFDALAGRPQVLKGSNDTQVRSAIHFDILREEAEEDLALDVSYREMFAQNVGRFALAIARRRYDVEQVTAIYGEEKAGYAYEFMQASIRHDLRIEEGSAMPRNYASREAKIVDMWRYNMIVRADGTPDPLAAWAMMDNGVVNPTLMDTMRARTSAENDFRRMLYLGEPVTPQPHENHALHLTTYSALMEEERFKKAPEKNRALVFAHVQQRAAMYSQLVAGASGQTQPPIVAPEENPANGGPAVPVASANPMQAAM